MERKPITILHNRRNAYNPEFLDMEALLNKYTPLLKSIHRYFCSYSGILDQTCDIEDLYSQIQTEFIRLTKAYDPRRGVDFPGYIKFNLRHRIYYYVTKLQNLQKTELKALKTDDMECEFNYLSEYVEQQDENHEHEILRIEAINSLPWNKLKTKEDVDLVINVLNHKTLEEIAKTRRTAVTLVREQFNRICEELIAHAMEE